MPSKLGASPQPMGEGVMGQEDKKSDKKNRNLALHSKKNPLVTGDLKEPTTVLQAIDREIDFYRKRSGEVFFFGLLVEVLILAGREKVVLTATSPLAQPIVYSIMFVAVAAIGIALGSEYRSRIRLLKD